MAIAGPGHNVPPVMNFDDSPFYPAGAAITEKVAFIAPGASARDALAILSEPAVGHLLVSPRGTTSPQGVVSELDLVRLASGG